MSSWHSLELKMAVDGDLATDIEKQGAFLSPEIVRLAVEPGTTIRYELRASGDRDAAVEKIRRHVDRMVANCRKLPRRVALARRRSDHGSMGTGVFDELVTRGWVQQLGPGQLAFRGPARSLLRAIDEDCRRIGASAWAADEELYPTLIPTRTLSATGYFGSFPQNASLVSHLTHDLDIIEAFREANEGADGIRTPAGASFDPPEACLSPAVCYHAYQALEGRELQSLRVVTSVGKCFRYESTNMSGLDRLWDFTMREIVFIGEGAEVAAHRARGLTLIAEQLDRWDLEGTVETANDPFFSAAYATNTYYQVREDLKLELRLAVEPSREGAPRALACGSLNLHEQVFGKAFGITLPDGRPASTGCLAWGLERWVLACFTQHGFEPDRWPATVRGQVFGEG